MTKKNKNPIWIADEAPTRAVEMNRALLDMLWAKPKKAKHKKAKRIYKELLAQQAAEVAMAAAFVYTPDPERPVQFEVPRSLAKAEAVPVRAEPNNYEESWGTPIGQDCIDLCTVLPRWLGERLMFMGKHTHTVPASYYTGDEDLDMTQPLERWREDLKKHAAALLLVGNMDWTRDEEEKAQAAAEKALLWVAVNLGSLWD